MNLAQLGVQEMDSKEIINVDGGILPLLALLLFDAACLGFLAGAYAEQQNH